MIVKATSPLLEAKASDLVLLEIKTSDSVFNLGVVDRRGVGTPSDFFFLRGAEDIVAADTRMGSRH